MARDDYGRGGDPAEEWRWRQQQQGGGGDWRAGWGGFGGNVGGYGRGGALDLGYGGADVGGRDAERGAGGTRPPQGRPGGAWGGGGQGGGWIGAGRALDDQARRGEMPPVPRGWQGGEQGAPPYRGDWERGRRGGGDRGEIARRGPGGFEPLRREDPHAWPDENLYGGQQALASPGPYHGGYATMERLARDEHTSSGVGGPFGAIGGGAGSFSTAGFNAGDVGGVVGGARGEYREAAMRGAVSLIGYNEAGLGRPHGGGYGTVPAARPTYAGRGPRGYRRPDERIREDVCEALTHHPEIDASGLEVRVADGEVTLEGTVDDRRAKRLAEDIAERCSGVHDVHNHLRVSAERAEGRSSGGRSGGGGGEGEDSPYRLS